MKDTIRVKHLVIGEGIPKICVPVTGITEEAILSQAAATKAAGPDLVEWRVDFYGHMREAKRVETMLEKLSAVLGDIPLLFTLRTDREGGSAHVEKEEYAAILMHAAACRETDLLDVEIMPDQEGAASIIAAAHENHTAVIGSNHHFEGTPANEEIDRIFSCMEQAGADILKMAVMPENSRDVVRMMERTVSWQEKTRRPLITMSMGSLGGVSRMCGELTGSCVTFASVTRASAPGQIDMGLLKNILQVLHN